MALACIWGGRECDGCGRCRAEGQKPRCPVCGAAAESFTLRAGEVVGCENCLEIRAAEDV